MKDSTIANKAAITAGDTAAGYGAGASTIGSALIPQLTRQINNPQGYSQQDIGSMLSSGLAGSGGATAGLTGAAGKMGMTERNPMGFSAALDAASRNAGKTNAGISEGITAQNAGVKMQQQSQAGDLLSKLYGTNVNAQTQDQSQVAKDAQIGNSMSPLNTTMGILGQLGGMASNASTAYKNF